jgi:uncharacterized protein YecA (UPF0149 family)
VGRERAVELAESTSVIGKPSFRHLAQRVELASKLAAQRRDDGPKVGRNERCPCRSGLKYKFCHGLTGRPPNVVSR